MTTILNGLLGGLLAALVGAAAARAVSGRLGDTSEPSGRVPTAGWLRVSLRALYGGVAGGTLVALDLFVFGTLGVPPTAAEAFGAAVVWSGALFVAAVSIRRFVRPPRSGRSATAESLAFHLAYGLCLGVWIRSTWIT